MIPMGKSLVFYFRYWTEMIRLCESDSGELEGLPEPEKTREMAREVGDKAGRQAADLLESCAAGLEAHFNAIGKCARVTSRKTAEKKWSLQYSIWPKKRFKPAKPKMLAGVDLLRREKPEIVPWLWRLGGDEAEQKLELILQGRAKVRSQDLEWDTGTVGLHRIALLPAELNGFDVDCESLIEQVGQTFRTVTPPELDALWP